MLCLLSLRRLGAYAAEAASPAMPGSIWQNSCRQGSAWSFRERQTARDNKSQKETPRIPREKGIYKTKLFKPVQHVGNRSPGTVKNHRFPLTGVQISPCPPISKRFTKCQQNIFRKEAVIDISFFEHILETTITK